MSNYNPGDVVQFNEAHRWCGSLGIIDEAKVCGDDIRYMIAIPVPNGVSVGTAYVFSMKSAKEFEYIGMSLFMPASAESEGD